MCFMDDTHVASAQVWPKRPVDCELLCHTVVSQKATEPLDCKLTDL